jgi:hypothetical protein
MSARDALVDGAKKASAVSRHQLHAYIGANDYFYEQVRRGPQSIQGLQAKLGADENPQRPTLARMLEQYTPKRMRESMQEQVEASRDQRKQFADRGQAIVADWRQASPVQDASALIHTVRSADGAGDLGRSLKTWLVEFPPNDVPTPNRSTAKTPSRKRPARKTSGRTTSARSSA